MTAHDQPEPAIADMPRLNPGARTCVLVLGMHRSGTSALTRLLNLAGATLPRRLMPAGPGNESGHWEPQHLVDCHDRLLEAIGSAWHDWTAADLTKLSADQLAALKSEIGTILREDYPDDGKGGILVVKDPRICRFAPLFMDAVESVGWRVALVHAFRNPLDVVNSLSSRKLVWPAAYTTTEAAFLWLRHVLDSERACRGRPRAVVSFDALMADPGATLAKIERACGLQLPNAWAQIEADVRGFLSPAQRHHAYTARDLDTHPDTCGWAAAAYNAMLALERDADDAAAGAALQTMAAQFDAMCPVLSRLLGEANQEVKALLAARTADISELTRRRDELEALNRRQQDALDAASAQMAALTSELAARTHAQENTKAQCRDLEQQLHASETERQRSAEEARQALEHERHVKTEEILQLQRQIADTHAMYLSSTSWRVTRPLRAVSRTPTTMKEAVRALPRRLRRT